MVTHTALALYTGCCLKDLVRGSGFGGAGRYFTCSSGGSLR